MNPMKAEKTLAEQVVFINSSHVYKLSATILSILFLLTTGVLSVPAQVATNPDTIPLALKQNVPDEDSYNLEKGMNELSIWAGGSFHTPTLIGTTEDSKLITVGIRYGRIFATSKRVAYEYTVDAVPLTMVSVPRFSIRQTGAGLFDFPVEKTRKYIRGGGISPVGFKINFKRRSRIQPFVSTSGGILYFREPVPVPEATQFNFTFDVGGGLQILTRSRKAFAIGYKFQHISNANGSRVNPGIDSNVLYIGFSFFR